MLFNKGRWQALHMGRNNRMPWYWLAIDWLQSGFAEEVLVDTELNQLYAVLSAVPGSGLSRARKMWTYWSESRKGPQRLVEGLEHLS